jgi:diguanylate cyclase (GGDEF)-like protein/PAS domain S-box-containing protein
MRAKLDNKTLAELGRLVQAAAYSAVCSNAMLFSGPDNAWELMAHCGPDRPLSLSAAFAGALCELFVHEELLILSDLLQRDNSALQLHGFDELPGRFMACVAVRGENGTVLGTLLVTHSTAHDGLSPAQIYTLQTHAAQLACRLEMSNSRALTQSNNEVIERLRLLESVVVHAKDAILITEAEPIGLPGPRIVYCNPAFLSTTGFSESEVLGQTPRILHCEETSRQTLDLVRASLQRWEPVEVELLNARRDGSRFWVELSIVPVANERGWFTHWVSVQRDISERKAAEHFASQAQLDRAEKIALEIRLMERERIEQELSYAAFHDGLTQLYNRAFIMDRLAEVFSHNPSDRLPQATVLFLDLDRFKLVNDSLGHRAGDLLLTVVARRLESCLRDRDVLARVGGDEFAILLSGEVHEDGAIDMAERIVKQLQAPVVIEGQNIFTSCSIGIVHVSTNHDSPEELLRDADVAMYAAKRKGTGLWTIFDGSMRDEAVESLLLQNALRQALVRDEFALHYQPIYDLATGRMKGIEALVRWRHPKRGMVAPEAFISVAEDIGLIHELGRWVMQQACSQLQAWKERYTGLDLQLNVNVSGRELKRPGYIEQVRQILVDTGFDAHGLQIEITETVFLHEPEMVGEVLEKVRALGVRVALDDFGTGYSSLGYIDRYPIDAIKIDRSFISRMMSFERTVAIVQSILWLGRTLELDITAEGIETAAQLQMLKDMQCPSVQGFLLCEPLACEQLTALLEQPAVCMASFE